MELCHYFAGSNMWLRKRRNLIAKEMSQRRNSGRCAVSFKGQTICPVLQYWLNRLVFKMCIHFILYRCLYLNSPIDSLLFKEIVYRNNGFVDCLIGSCRSALKKMKPLHFFFTLLKEEKGSNMRRSKKAFLSLLVDFGFEVIFSSFSPAWSKVIHCLSVRLEKIIS